ncbi:hypothetical protein CWE04_11885 [Thomasclavelia cocleata]|uniref:Uncharacterized protein n=1 Tax=Thomasclavelia cocleata TaxID=69824 RepID=A0A1I0BL14_9FIRM|nr:hypothetical protein [Thomasclavelia cocleata]MCR1960196.1 hypothetical protein [Thomasclavelia cocleata]NDO41830.1 hypothetical protein [Thomasclavelia cocleata]PJN79902.1 hypothetical protein CWE04_11885 [Thomasclavelia cocleata]SET07628.1 hypothetical protein SAMN04489758_101169 [Thomasclavelia cocleata]
MSIKEKESLLSISQNSNETLEENDENMIKTDCKLLCSKISELNGIFEVYVNKINPMIFTYEILADNYPIEILNEIRSIFTHLSRCTFDTDEKNVNNNLTKAYSHAKRAILDCYKYNSLAYADKYYEFMDQYKNVDLSLIDNGEFLIKITNKLCLANSLMIQAKRSEAENKSLDEQYTKYENAYFEYSEIYKILENTQIKAENLKQKAIIKSNKENRKILINNIIGIIGVIATIISIATVFI